MENQKATQQELGCKFMRLEPGKEEFHIFRAINKIFRHIKQSSKKTQINKISTRLLGSEFKSDNTIKPKTMKFILKKTLSDYK